MWHKENKEKCVPNLTSWNLIFIFSQYRKIILSFCSTLVLFAIPQPEALGLQTGWNTRANRRVHFFYKGNKTKNKIPACQTRCTTLHFHCSKQNLKNANKILFQEIYGQEYPPSYSLDVITSPVATYWSLNDWLASPSVTFEFIFVAKAILKMRGFFELVQ